MKSLFVLASAFFIAAEVNAQQLTTETPLVDKAFTLATKTLYKNAGLTRTYLTDQVHKLSLLQLEVYLIQHAQVLLVYFHIFISYQRFSHSRLIINY